MNEPRTEAAGELHFYLAGVFAGTQPRIVTVADEYAKRIEAEAAALERERLRADWEDRKRTRASVMHDVGYTMREVDDLLDEPTP